MISKSAHRRNTQRRIGARGMARLRKQAKARHIRHLLNQAEETRRKTGLLPRQANGKFVPTRSWRAFLLEIFGGRKAEAVA